MFILKYVLTHLKGDTHRCQLFLDVMAKFRNVSTERVILKSAFDEDDARLLDLNETIFKRSGSELCTCCRHLSLDRRRVVELSQFLPAISVKVIRRLEGDQMELEITCRVCVEERWLAEARVDKVNFMQAD